MTRDSFIFYGSFHDAIADLDNEQYGCIMRIIAEYALNGEEPEINNPIIKMAFTLIKPQIDANNKRYEDGKKGGRPKKENAEETIVQEVSEPAEENKKPLVSEIKNHSFENKKPNVNDNVNENVNVNDTHNANSAPPDVCVPSLPPNYKDFQEKAFSAITQHNKTAPNTKKIPVSNTLLAFVQKECRLILSALRNEHPAVILAALNNYILVAQSDTWRKSHTINSFVSHYQEYLPAFFDISKFLNGPSSEQKQPEKKEPERKLKRWWHCKCGCNYSMFNFYACPKCDTEDSRHVEEAENFPADYIAE